VAPALPGGLPARVRLVPEDSARRRVGSLGDLSPEGAGHLNLPRRLPRMLRQDQPAVGRQPLTRERSSPLTSPLLCTASTLRRYCALTVTSFRAPHRHRRGRPLDWERLTGAMVFVLKAVGPFAVSGARGEAVSITGELTVANKALPGALS